jgi:hypothetical protein
MKYNFLYRGRLFLLIALILLNQACFSQDQWAVFLIPEGYTGTVIVIYNQSNGETSKIESGKHIYRIPSNGVLYTQEPYEYKYKFIEYYYYDQDGKPTAAISYISPNQMKELKKRRSTMSSDKNKYIYGNGLVHDGQSNKRFLRFVIGELDQADELIRHSYEDSNRVLSKEH